VSAEADLQTSNTCSENKDRKGEFAAGEPGAPSGIHNPKGTTAASLPVSSGLICLCLVAGHHQRTADPQQLARSLGWDPAAPVNETQLILAAKELGLKAKSARSSWSGLGRVQLPAIVELRDGGYALALRSRQ